MTVGEWLIAACAVVQLAVGASGLVLTRRSGRLVAREPRVVRAFRLLVTGVLLSGASALSGVARRAADDPGVWWSAVELAVLGLALVLIAVGLLRLRRESRGSAAAR